MKDITWLIQNNYVESMTGKIAVALREHKKPIIDFSVVGDQPLPEFSLPDNSLPFFYGSTVLIKKAKTNPLYSDKVFFNMSGYEQKEWNKNRGPDMLNATGTEITWGQLSNVFVDVALFIRPANDLKTFTGTVITPDGFPDWKAEQERRNRLLTKDTVVWSARVQDIQEEYRFVVWNHNLITGSRYRANGFRGVTANIPPDVIHAGQYLALGWLPDELTVMDIARLGNGSFRIIEFNCIHTSGLYAIPIKVFIDVVELACNKKFR